MFAQRYEFGIFEKNDLFVKPLQLLLILANSQSILYKAGYNLINTAPENWSFDYIQRQSLWALAHLLRSVFFSVAFLFEMLRFAEIDFLESWELRYLFTGISEYKMDLFDIILWFKLPRKIVFWHIMFLLNTLLNFLRFFLLFTFKVFGKRIRISKFQILGSIIIFLILIGLSPHHLQLRNICIILETWYILQHLDRFIICVNGWLKQLVILSRESVCWKALLTAISNIFGYLLVVQVWYSHVLLPSNLLWDQPVRIVLTIWIAISFHVYYIVALTWILSNK